MRPIQERTRKFTGSLSRSSSGIARGRSYNLFKLEPLLSLDADVSIVHAVSGGFSGHEILVGYLMF